MLRILVPTLERGNENNENITEEIMTTITLDDTLIKQIMAMSHYKNAQDAVTNIIANYLQQQTITQPITELLAMPNAADIDFEPEKLTTLHYPVDLS
jgi:plasmid stability protein